MFDWKNAFKIYYEGATWFFLIAPLIVFPVTFVIVAPFGRFAPNSPRFTCNGVFAWMIMEITPLAVFIPTYIFAPFSPNGKPPPLNHTSTLLAGLFILHYLNRAIISPLRSPGRARIHIAVMFSAILFNIINAPLMAAYLSAPDNIPHPLEATVTHHLKDEGMLAKVYQLLSFDQVVPWMPNLGLGGHSHGNWTHPTFLIGITIFVFGLVSNIVHDEILYNLRRNNPPRPDGKPHYAIPYGYLYKYISFPNYFSEWIEFTGFAIAASPKWEYTPPWMFVVAEIMVMLPRAYKGHKWYLEKFPDYPKDRKAVIPFIL